MIIPLLAATLLASASGTPAPADQGFTLIHVADLAQMLKDPSQSVRVLDANNADFRAKEGVIPGATLLPESHDYNVAKELPQNKGSTLVFYCANTQCMASHAAASRAVQAGYTHVDVLADGLQGWKQAGQPVAKP
jgi:rhodanese-related sulfurtransferase